MDCTPKLKDPVPELACLVVSPKENALGVPPNPNPVVWLEVLEFPNNELCCMWDSPPKENPLVVPLNPVVRLGVLPKLNPVCRIKHIKFTGTEPN